MLGLFGPKGDKGRVYTTAFVYQGRFRKRFSAGSSVINEVVLEGAFLEVGLSLLLLACGLFFLHDLQALDHLEGEAHYAAVLALVLEVDGFIVVVDESLGEDSLVVIETLS